MALYRQGDVLLISVGDVPAGRSVPREQGRIVLAHGEVTGHAHAIVDESAELISAGEAQEMYLVVYGDRPAALVHEEHDTLLLPPGGYRVVRQREYAPSAPDFTDWVHD